MPGLPRDGVGKPDRDWKAYFEKTRDLPPPARTMPFLDLVPDNGSVLDFGCGSGRFAVAFHRDKPRILIDVLDAHLDKTPLLTDAGWLNRRLHQRFEDFRAHEAYDGIWAQATLFFVPPEKQQDIFQRLGNALKPRGVLAFTFVEPCHETGFPFNERSKEDLEKMLHNAGMKIEKLVHRTDITYGSSKTAIPTFIIYARKT